MKFLVDQAMSPTIATFLNVAKHDAVHVRTIGMAKAADIEIFQRALIEERVIISVDTDFAMLIATQNTRKPSLILIRWAGLRLAEDQVRVILENLPGIEQDLDSGAIVTIEEGRVRVRSLPIHKSNGA